MALLNTLSLTLLALASTALAAAAPSLPLSTSSRWILDASGSRVKLRCVNWAGHMETHVPEGLHRQPISKIAQTIEEQGFNCVRLTYSIDWALNPNETVAHAFANAAGLAGVPEHNATLTGYYDAAVALDPSLATSTVRDVYGAVVDALWDRGVMTILDNHVSRAQWCCNLTDGNGWWDTGFGYVADNSRFFNTSEWLAGLQAAAAWARASHPGVVGLSLRNEIRQSWLQGTNGPYDDWYDNIGRAAGLVHAAHPDALIVVGGGWSATDLTMVGGRDLDWSGWAGKHVWEFHAYSFTVTFQLDLGNCALEKAEYGKFDGYVLSQGERYTAPLILSEFGVAMTGGSKAGGLSDDDYDYLTCLVGYMTNNDAEWALWAIQGSYYLRNGAVDYNETWGVLDYTWSQVRNPQFSGLLGAMWNVTQGP